ncbi:DUF6265 family protein [Roseateles toxinivorans]|nr:DUF6265 family protein [Roseateles toxinivorans]
MPAEAQQTELASLSWLSGCWASEGGEPGSVEHWLPPAGGTMLGLSRTVKKGKTVAHEFMQIRASAEGRLVYIALPSGQKETTFTLDSAAEGEVTFENPQHDFPQRVIYRLLPDDRLAARIEGMRNGQLRGIDFAMKKMPC